MEKSNFFAVRCVCSSEDRAEIRIASRALLDIRGVLYYYC